MTKNTKNKIAKLKQIINQHDKLYYNENQPKISDQKYDELFLKLKQLEKQKTTKNSPTKTIHKEHTTGFKNITHKTKMLSINNTYNQKELKDFDEKIAKQLQNQKYEYIVELKIDGLAVNLLYENKKLKTAATRGNGSVGDDVTKNIKTIKSIPKTLTKNAPKNIEIKGEVYMTKENFAKLNKQKQENQQQLFANPRNAAAGSLKLLNPKITATRNLNFLPYAIGYTSEKISEKHLDSLNKIEKFGIKINPNVTKAKNINDVIEICQKWEKIHTKLDYQIDGMVIKINDLKQQQLLGQTSRSPRWAIAYKFAPEQAQTKIESIAIQVGKTGIITPVANMTPVQLAGTIVKRASLHNFDEIKRLDVRVGDQVIIEKAGEIIPQVMKVLKEKRPKISKIFPTPKVCPGCGKAIEKSKDEVYIRCTNKNCKAILIEKIIYFAAKGQMDIENLGDAVVKQLVEKNINENVQPSLLENDETNKITLVKNFADIYQLTTEQLIKLDRMGKKSAQNIIDAIEKSKTNPLWRFVAALGIRHVGSQTAQILAENFPTIKDLTKADLQTLAAIDQIGPKMAQSIYDYFQTKTNQAIIDKIIKTGLLPTKTIVNKNTQITGKTIVLTGTLKNLSRQQAKEAIKTAGAKVSSSVSKKTDLVLAGEKPGSKVKKAEQLSIKIITEQQFIELIKENVT